MHRRGFLYSVCVPSAWASPKPLINNRLLSPSAQRLRRPTEIYDLSALVASVCVPSVSACRLCLRAVCVGGRGVVDFLILSASRPCWPFPTALISQRFFLQCGSASGSVIAASPTLHRFLILSASRLRRFFDSVRVPSVLGTLRHRATGSPVETNPLPGNKRA
jgi:hypothetical protein